MAEVTEAKRAFGLVWIELGQEPSAGTVGHE